MPITVEARESASIVEPGVYEAKIVDMAEENGQYGAQIKFVFELADVYYESGSRAGENVQQWGWASATLSPKSKLWKWLKNVTGITPVFGQGFDVTGALLNQPVQIVLNFNEETQRVVVSDVLKSRNGAAPAPARPAAQTQAQAPAAQQMVCKFPKCGRQAFSFDEDGNEVCPKHGGNPA